MKTDANFAVQAELPLEWDTVQLTIDDLLTEE